MAKEISCYFLKAFITGVLLCLLGGVCHAQQISEAKSKFMDGSKVGASFHTGTLLNHHNYMGILTEKNAWLLELYMVKPTDGSKEWHSFFGYPDVGVKLTIMDMGSPTYIGKAYSLHPYMKFYLLGSSRRFRPSIAASAGPAYIEKIFDRKTNYKNAAIGSHINAFLQLQFDLNVRLADNIEATAGFSFSHFSNGSFKKPNAGANIVGAKLGASYTFGQPEDRTLKAETIPSNTYHKRWNYQLILSGGLKEIDVGDGRYGVAGMSFETSRQHLAFTRFSGSFDVFYDGSDYHKIRNHISYSEDGLSRLQTVKLGLAAGYELLFGSMSVNFQLGAYLYAKQKDEGILYQRFTLRYMPTSRVGVQFGLKSHMGVADYIELGCIYRIK